MEAGAVAVSEATGDAEQSDAPELSVESSDTSEAPASEPADDAVSPEAEETAEPDSQESAPASEQNGITTQVELQTAIDAAIAAGGGTVTLTQDIEITGTPLIVDHKGTSVVIDGAGHSLTLAAGYNDLHLSAYLTQGTGSNVSIQNMTVTGHADGSTGGGFRLAGNNSNSSGTATTIYSVSNVTFNHNHWDTSNGVGGGLYATWFCTVNLKNCVFKNNSSTRGGAMSWGVGAFVNGVDCLFQNNRSIGNGGAVANGGSSNYSEVSFTNTRFIGNTAQSNGGAISVTQTTNPHTITLVGCTFEDNQATGRWKTAP